jgi:hypothetical protein
MMKMMLGRDWVTAGAVSASTRSAARVASLRMSMLNVQCSMFNVYVNNGDSIGH